MVTWTSSDHTKQNELFEQLLNAAFHYVIPSVMEDLLLEIDIRKSLVNRPVQIGPVQVTQNGISFESKWLLFTKQNQVPWSRVDVVHHNGTATVVDKVSGNKSLPISLRDVPNAIMLRFLLISFNRN